MRTIRSATGSRILFVAVLLILAAWVIGSHAVGAEKSIRLDSRVAQLAQPAIAAASASQPDKKITFEMRDKPWSGGPGSVLEWLSDQAGMPVSTSSAKPTGTLTFISPRVDGVPKQYSLPEVIDILNDELLKQNLILVRRAKTFTVEGADKPIDPAALPRVTPNELEQYGNTEMVSVVFPLKALVADVFAKEVEGMLGPFGKVQSLEHANKLVVQDTAGNLKRIREIIKDTEDTETKQGTSYSHPCKWIKARDAAKILKDLLGDPTLLLRALQAQQQSGGRGFGGQFGGQFPGPFGQQQGAPQQATVNLPKIRMHYISVDEASNSVIVTGPADKTAQAKEIMEKLDVPQQGQKPILLGPPRLMTYSVPGGNAEAVAKNLQEIYRSAPDIRISAVGPNQIMVYAGPSDQFEILEQIKGSKEQSGEPKVIPLTAMDASDAVDTLKGMFGSDPAKGAPFLKADTSKNAVVVKGTPEQIGDIEAALKALGEGGSAPGGNMRIITIDGGSATTTSIAESLQRMLPQLLQNPVQVITPGGSGPNSAEPRKTEPPAKSNGKNESGSSEEQEAPPAGQFVDPQQQPAPKNNQPAGKGAPIKITAFGNKLIITSDDPNALKTAQELVRLMTQPQGGTGDYDTIRLKNASATDAAKALDEAFNGPRQTTPTQQGFGGFGGRFFGPFAAAGATTPANPSPNTIRVVAYPPTNTLLVRASPLDMIRIRQLLKNAIDVEDTDSKGVMKTWYLKLQHARASEVADVIRDVYREYTNNNPQQTSTGGFPGFGFRGRGGFQNQNIDASGNPRGVTLSVGVDATANQIVVNCNESLYQDIQKMVAHLDTVEGTRQVKVIPLQGVDPLIVQQAIDALQGRRTTTTQPGMTPGGFGSSPFGGGGRGGGGFNPGFNPGQGFNPGMTPGGRGGGGGGQPGGGRGPGQQSRGPDFFDYRVKDDPRPSLFYDPQQPSTDASHNSNDRITNGSRSLASTDSSASIQLAQYEEQQQPLAQPSPDVRGPRGSVTADALEQLGAIVVSGSQADIEAITQIIELIRRLGAGAEVQIQLVPLEYADATSVSSILNQLFQRVVVGPGGNVRSTAPTTTATQTTPFGATTSISQQQSASVVLLPLPRFNAILMAAARARVPDILAEIRRLDRASSQQGRPSYFPLRKASASRVATLLNTYYSSRYPNETLAQNQIRITNDDSTNTVIVQAAPADLEEIRGLIERMDNTVSSAVNDLRIVPLKFALASDLATLIVQSISQGIVAPTTPVAAPTAAAPGAPPGGLAPGLARPAGVVPGAPTAAAPAVAPTAQTTGTTKTISLRFFSPRPGGPGPLEAGVLEDIHITPDARTNSLILAAQSKTMELLLSLINEMDVPPPYRAVVKLFPLQRADASIMATLLQQLFFGTGGVPTGTAAPVGAAGGALPGAAGGGATTGAAVSGIPTTPLTLGGPPEAPPLVPLQISVDVRTNSLIVSATATDMQVIEAVISRLDESALQMRENRVIQLRYAGAADVAATLNGFLTNALSVVRNAGQLGNWQELLNDVVIFAEPISNRLLVSASPPNFPRVLQLIDELDVSPPQVVIQVLIAEVDLTNTEEFGVELGLQSPVLFTRSIIPAENFFGTGGTVSYSNPGMVPPGVMVSSTVNPAAQPGFNFNDVTVPLGNNPVVSPGIVGFQGLSNLGVGRVSPTGVGGFVFSAASNTFNLLIRALKTQGRIDILSRPQIMTTDNQTALVNIGQDVPYVSAVTITGTGLATPTVTYRAVGVIMQVTPRISPDGTVLMRVIPEVSSVLPTMVNLGNGVMASEFNVQHFETTVTARDGETVAIGGLIQKKDTKTENKYPWLGDLPYIGALWRYRTQSKNKTELMVILTPHIVRSPMDADRVLAEEAKRMDWIVGDVVKTQGISGMAPILPPPSPALGAGTGQDPLSASPFLGLPAPTDLLPGPVSNEPVPPEPLPRPRVVPQPPSSTRPMSQIPTPSGTPLPATAGQLAASAPDATGTLPSQAGQPTDTDASTPPDPPKEKRGWSLFPWRK
jgi:type II secretory pathway component GspD/PulD (secretin)